MNDLQLIPAERNKISRLFIGNARTVIMVFILFTVVVVMTTDIRFVTISSIKDLGLEFFLILFSSYSMYICCADGGIKSGYDTDSYKEAVNRFNDLKRKIEDSMLSLMNEFCIHYVDEELKNTRMQYLSTACISYDIYMEKYAKLGKREVAFLTELTSFQKKAVIKANRVRRIRLEPNKILTLGKTVNTRSAFVTSPGTMKNIAFGMKMFKMSFVSFSMSLIAFDIILEPSWLVFAEVCLKLATVVINGFGGHKDGFINITVYTVNYVNNQSALMQQALLYNEQRLSSQRNSS